MKGKMFLHALKANKTTQINQKQEKPKQKNNQKQLTNQSKLNKN